MAQDALSTTALSPETPVTPIRFRLSEDGMRGYLDLTTGPPDAKLGMEDFLAAWTALGLESNQLHPERVLEAADGWNQSHLPQSGILVAESPRPPKSGIDGRLEFLVNLAPDSPSPGPAENTKVDHHSVRAIRAVEKDQPLVRRHPPQPGEPGVNLRGQEVPAPETQDVTLPEGEQVRVDAKDPNVLVAVVSGYVEWERSRLIVRDCFIVNGAVDYASGNVDYERSVLVKGDVHDGFSVRAGGNLEVTGSLGDAHVTAIGNVVIHGGFVGTGQGRLNTQGSLQVGFVSNQTARAYQTLSVAKESFNAHLSTKDCLIISGPLVGGIAVAGLRIECKSLGNELGTRTEVELGADYLDLEARTELGAKIAELSNGLQKLRTRTAKIKEAFKKTRRLSSADAKELFELRQKTEAMAALLPTLEGRLKEIGERIRQAIQRKGVELKVEGKIYPGVTIRVGNQILRVPEMITGPRYFNYFEERIHMF